VVRHQGRPSACNNMTDSIGRSILDGTVFVNDPDVVFCRTSRMGLSEAEKELVALVCFTLASQLMFSDDTHDFGASAGEAAFTARIVALFDRIGNREFAAERVDRDVYSVCSRDGEVRGIANLSDRAWRGPAADSSRAIVAHVEEAPGGAPGGGLLYAARTISLFEAR
jgi:alpha-galactosidase